MLTTAVWADGDAGRESPFSLGAGGRIMGMGRASVALNGDASAAFWNPAATSLIDRSDFVAFHTTLFMATNYDCLGLSYPLASVGVFSLSAGRLGTDGIEERDLYNRTIGKFSSSEFQFGLSYARAIMFGFSGGFTLKNALVEIDNDAGSGIGLDLGMQYRPTIIRGMAIGASFENVIKPKIKLISVEDKLSSSSRFGASYSRVLSAKIVPTASIEFEKSDGRGSRFRAGLEATYDRAYSLRFGTDDGTPTFGLGIGYGSFRLDYGYENVKYFGGSHRVSLGIAFGKPLKMAQEEARALIVKDAELDWQRSLAQEQNASFHNSISRGDSLKLAGKFQDALSYYQKALAINDTSVVARTKSDSMMTRIISDAASNASDSKREGLISSRIQAGLDAFKEGRYNDAISQYQLAADIDPGNSTVTNLLASARDTRQTQIDRTRENAHKYRDSGDYSSALTEWNDLLALDPTDAEAKLGIDISRNLLKADALIMSAINSMKKEDYQKAVMYLQQAQSFKPDDKSIVSLLSEARAKSAPLTTLETIKASPDNWTIYLKGLESYQSGDYTAAAKNWESLRDYYPNNPDLEKNITQARQRLSTEGRRP